MWAEGQEVEIHKRKDTGVVHLRVAPARINKQLFVATPRTPPAIVPKGNVTNPTEFLNKINFKKSIPPNVVFFLRRNKNLISILHFIN